MLIWFLHLLQHINNIIFLFFMLNLWCGDAMKYIIKRNIDLFSKENIIKFEYNVQLNKAKNGFEDFDIDNEEIMIDELLTKLDIDTIRKLDKVKQLYVSLSDYFFEKLEKLYAIEYETLDAVSKVFREDLYNNNHKMV